MNHAWATKLHNKTADKMGILLKEAVVCPPCCRCLPYTTFRFRNFWYCSSHLEVISNEIPSPNWAHGVRGLDHLTFFHRWRLSIPPGHNYKVTVRIWLFSFMIFGYTVEITYEFIFIYSLLFSWFDEGCAGLRICPMISYR